MPLQKLYLIGGAPLTGKTTYATKLALRHHGVPLSTDNIREWMRRLCNAADYPKLHADRFTTPQEYYNVFDTPEKVLAEEIAQSEDVERGIESVLASRLPWEVLVLEGIAVTPKLAAKLSETLPNLAIEPIFLHDANRDRIKNRIYSRGLWSSVAGYPDDLKAMEVDCLMLYNEWYKAQAKKYSYAVKEITE